MAKDFDKDLDNLEDFEDLDFEDMDFDDIGDSLEVEDGKGRTPVQKAVHRTYKAAVEEVKSRKIRDHALGIMENSLSSDGKVALSELRGKIDSSIEETTKAFEPLRNSLASLTKGLKDVTPTGGRLNTFFTNMSKRLGKEDATAEAITQQQEQLANFQGEIENAFGNMNQQLQNVIAQTQQSRGLGSLLQQNNAIQNLIKEQNRVYYTKSLQLQWRIAHATEESNTLAREQFEAYTKIFNTIVHNTSLPEAVKISNSEMAMVNLKNRAFNTLNDTLFKQVLPIDKIQKNLLFKLREKISDVTDGIDTVNDFLDIGKDLQESGLKPEDMIGSQLGSYALNKLYGGLARFIPRKHRGRLEQGIMGMLADPLAYLKSQRVKEPSGILGKLFNKAVGGFEDLVGPMGPESNGVKLANSNLNMQAIFDGRTHNSINVVIPRLLSKIHSEVYGLRTGKNITEDDELRYDVGSSTFITTREARRNLESDVKKFTIDVARKSAQGIAKHVSEVLSNVDTVDPEIKNRVLRILPKAILGYTTQYGSISPDALTSKEFLAYYPPELQIEAADLFHEFIRDIRNYNKLSSTYSMFRTASSMLNMSPQLLQERVSGMDRDIVRRMGLVDINRHTGESAISAKGYQNLINSRYGIKAHSVDGRISNEFDYDPEIDWVEDTRSTLLSAADYIQNIGKDRDTEPDYFKDGGRYRSIFGTEIIRAANTTSDLEQEENEIAIKKRIELEEFINTDAMVKLREADPDAYNREINRFKNKLDNKYERKIQKAFKKAWGYVTGQLVDEDGNDISPTEAAKNAYNRAINNSQVLNRADSTIRSGISKTTEKIKEANQRLKETELYQDAVATTEELIDTIKNNEKVKDITKVVKDKYTAKQEELMDFINKNVVSKEQRDAAISYIKTLDKDKLEELYQQTKANVKAKAEGGRDVAVMAIRSLAGDEEAKVELSNLKDNIISKANEGFDIAKTKTTEISNKAIKTTNKLSRKAKKKLKAKGIDIDSISNKLKPTKKVKDSTDTYEEGQSPLNVTTPDFIATGIKKSKQVKSKVSSATDNIGKRFVKVYTTSNGSFVSTREDIPIPKPFSINNILEQVSKNSKNVKDMLPNMFHYFKNGMPMSNVSLKELKEQIDAMKAEGKDTKDLNLKYREELKKATVSKIKKNTERLIKQGIINPEDGKYIVKTAEEIDVEKLKDPFFLFTLFKNMGGMAKYTAELGWEVGKTLATSYPKFWKSGFAKSMRAREREFYKGIWDRMKRPFRDRSKDELEMDLDPEAKAKKRKGSWINRLMPKFKSKDKKPEGTTSPVKEGFFDKLKKLFKPLLLLIPPFIGKVLDFFKPLGNFFKGMYEGIKFVGKGIGQVVSLLGKLVGGLFKGAGAIVTGATGAVGKAVDFFKGKKAIDTASDATKAVKAMDKTKQIGKMGETAVKASKVAEASEKLTKKSIIDKIVKIASGFKTFITKKFGKIAGSKIIATLSAKLALRGNPVTGPALLAWDAGWIVGMLATGLTLKSAISKQLLGFDLFDDNEAAVDENGEPIKPDEDVKETSKEEDLVQYDQNTREIGSKDSPFYMKETNKNLKVSDKADKDLMSLLYQEKAKYANKDGKLSGKDLLHRDFMLSIRLLKPADRNVELTTKDITGVERTYGEYRLATYTIGEPDPDVVWTINKTDEITIGRMKRNWYQFGFGSKDVFEPLNIKDYIKEVKKLVNGKGLLQPDDPDFTRKYLAYIGFKIRMIKEEIIKKAKSKESKSYDSALAFIEGKDHTHKDGGQVTQEVKEKEKDNKSQTDMNIDHIKNKTIPSKVVEVQSANNVNFKQEALKGVQEGGTKKAVKAAMYVSKNAHDGSKGKCARYVANGLEAAGYKFQRQPSAYMYATNGTLAKMGFTEIDNRTPPQAGDILVFPRSSSTPHGHIQIYDGKVYNSDFKQVGGALKRDWNSPGEKYRGLVPTMWRDLGNKPKDTSALDRANEKVENVPDDKAKVDNKTASQVSMANPEPISNISTTSTATSMNIPVSTMKGNIEGVGDKAAILGVTTAIEDGNKVQGSQLNQLEMLNKNVVELISVISKEPPKPSDRVQDLRKEEAKSINPPVNNSIPPSNKSNAQKSIFDTRQKSPFSVTG